MVIELHILKVLQLFDTNCFKVYTYSRKKRKKYTSWLFSKEKKIVKQNIVFIKSQTHQIDIWFYMCLSVCCKLKILVLGRVFKKVKGNGISNRN